MLPLHVKAQELRKAVQGLIHLQFPELIVILAHIPLPLPSPGSVFSAVTPRGSQTPLLMPLLPVEKILTTGCSGAWFSHL